MHSRASSAMSTGARATACGFWLSVPAFSTCSTVVQPLGVGKHDVVELLPSCVVNVSRLQLQVEPHRRDRGLQLVRDRIDEGLVTSLRLISSEEHRVDDDAGDDQGEQDDAENQRGQAPGVDHDPADVQRHGRAHKEDAEGYEEANGLLPAGHSSIVGQSSNRVSQQSKVKRQRTPSALEPLL